MSFNLPNNSNNGLILIIIIILLPIIYFVWFTITLGSINKHLKNIEKILKKQNNIKIKEEED